MQKSYRCVDLIQRSPEWLAFKEGKIGSSDAAAIMGLSPWETRYEAWHRFVFGRAEKKITAAMQRGIDLESEALSRLNKQTGRNYLPLVIQDLNFPLLIASLDAYWEDEEGEVHIVEMKIPGEKTHKIALEGIVPEHYKPQVAYQRFLAKPKEMGYFSWDGKSEAGVLIDCPQDEKYMKCLEENILRFLDCVDRFTLPDWE